MNEAIEEFLKVVHGGKGELDAWLEVNDEKDCRAVFKAVFAAQPVPKAPTATVLSDAQINEIWKKLPGIEIFNKASRSGVSTEYALRIAFARALEAAHSNGPVGEVVSFSTYLGQATIGLYDNNVKVGDVLYSGHTVSVSGATSTILPEGLIEALEEASKILCGEAEARGPLADELAGFAHMLRDNALTTKEPE